LTFTKKKNFKTMFTTTVSAVLMVMAVVIGALSMYLFYREMCYYFCIELPQMISWVKQKLTKQ
jgi:hypothetical protein